MLIFGSNESCRRRSCRVLVIAFLVALLGIGLAWTGDRFLGDSFDKWGPLVIASLGGTYAVTCGCICRRSRRGGRRPEPIDDGDDELPDWPSAGYGSAVSSRPPVEGRDL